MAKPLNQDKPKIQMLLDIENISGTVCINITLNPSTTTLYWVDKFISVCTMAAATCSLLILGSTSNTHRHGTRKTEITEFQEAKRRCLRSSRLYVECSYYTSARLY